MRVMWSLTSLSERQIVVMGSSSIHPSGASQEGRNTAAGLPCVANGLSKLALFPVSESGLELPAKFASVVTPGSWSTVSGTSVDLPDSAAGVTAASGTRTVSRVCVGTVLCETEVVDVALCGEDPEPSPESI